MSGTSLPIQCMDPPSAGGIARIQTALREMAVQDWMMLAYHLTLVTVAYFCPPGPTWLRTLLEMSCLLGLTVLALIVARAHVLLGARGSALLYRFTMIGTVEVSYFFFRRLLPAANPASLDHALYNLDMAWFGFEPAVWFQSTITPEVTEWFSFFYFSYFVLLAAHVLAVVFLGRRRRPLGEFTFALIFTFSIGHLTYLLVPGYGPGVAMPELFSVPLPDGAWHAVMLDMVQTGGAQKDIFPSIHTAVPATISLWCFRQRASIPHKYTWPLVCAFSLNIILATMYLRWHYLIDVIAGLLLGTFALWLATHLTDYELKKRRRAGLPPVWPEMTRS